MSRKNSAGAVSAIERSVGHLAKAVLELRQAERELEDVRGLGAMGPTFLADVGALKTLRDYRERLLELWGSPDAGLRLKAETPEEGP